MEKNAIKLEFNKIIEKVARNAVSKSVKEQILMLQFLQNNKEIEREILKNTEANNLLMEFGVIDFAENYDCKSIFSGLLKLRPLNVKDLLQLKFFFETAKVGFNYFNQTKTNFNYTVLIEFFAKLFLPAKELSKLNETIDENGEFLDSASPRLGKIRKEIKSLSENSKKRIYELKKIYSPFLTDEQVIFKSGFWCLVVSVVYKRKIKGNVVDTSNSGQSIYVEPGEMQQFRFKLSELRNEEEKEKEKILKQLMDFLLIDLNKYIEAQNALLKLDYYFACAKFFVKHNCCTPVISKDKSLKLIEARHPLIDENKVVPIDFYIYPNKPLTIITGPNTGGKTASMKTVGLFSLMLKVGFLIPAKEAILPNYSKVFVDIGDEQSLEQNLSTFSSHMVRLISFISDATPDSLVLLDEPGSGTDPLEGQALALAIIKHLLLKNCTLILTTHYPKVKMLQYLENSTTTGVSVCFDIDTLSPTYKLSFNSIGNSNAILIAKRLGMNDKVLKDAEAYLSNQDNKSEELLTNLAANIEKNEQLTNELKYKETLLNSLITQNKEIKEKQEKEFSKRVESVLKVERKKWEDSVSEIETLVKELKEIKAINVKKISEIKQGIKRPENEFDSNVELKIGDLVYVEPIFQDGVIRRIKGDLYFVNIEGNLLKFKKNDLKLKSIVSPKKQSIKPLNQSKKTVSEPFFSPANFEIDLRGKRVHEVENILAKEIDKLILANFTQAKIIHGYGTGAVKNAVYDYIKKHPKIKSHRFGGEFEGQMGVTIIYLK